MMPAYADAQVMRNSKITIDGVEYANQTTKARLVPDTPVQTQRTLVPDGVVQDVDSTVWTFELSGLESRQAGGVAKALDAAAGDVVDIVLQPRVGSGEDTATFSVIAKPVPFGGTSGEWRSFEIELPVVGGVTFGTAA